MNRSALFLPLPLLCPLVGCLPLSTPEFGASSTTSTSDDETDPTAASWPAPPLDRTTFGPSGSSTSATATAGPATSSSDSTAGEAIDGPPPDLSGLRLTEFLVDPPGKDGAAGAPEYIEIANLSPDPIALDGLVVRARSWPRLDAPALGLSGHTLPPGGLLLLRRFAKGEGPPSPTVESAGALLTVEFSSGEGLRNNDGAAMIEGPLGIVDAVIYGLPAPAPYDDPSAWQGPPAPKPASARALCRPIPALDSDSAIDWSECEPTPGSLPAEDNGTSTSDTGDTGDTEGAIDTGDLEDSGEPPLAPTIAIVEVLSNPPGPAQSEKFFEYVEILNYGDASIDLAGWTVADSLADAPPGQDPLLAAGGDGGCAPATCLAPGRRALIVGNAYQGPTGGALVLATDDTTIADGGLSAAEPVVLRDPDGVMISTYRAWPDPKADPYPLNVEEPLHRAAPAAVDEASSWSYGPSSPGSE